MTVGVKVGSIISEIGSASFLNAFFSTIVGLLENDKAGSRYPIISRELYHGHLSYEQAAQAVDELESIQKEFLNYLPTAVIWDLEDRSKTPPWGNNISPKITSMANYFVTSTGRDLFGVFFETLAYAMKRQRSVSIV